MSFVCIAGGARKTVRPTDIRAGLDVVGAVVMKMVRPIKMLHSNRSRCCCYCCWWCVEDGEAD